MARRRIEIEVLVDPALAQKGFQRTGAAAKMFGRDVERAGRGAASASLSFHGLGRSVAFASGAFLGGAGLVSAFKSTIKAAEESQRVMGQTQNALKRSGQSWAEYGKQIQAAALAQSKLSGFDDERLLGTFSQFERRTKDVNAALRLNATAANVARGRHIELEAAAQLVMKASMGQAGALRRVGIDAQKGATGVQLLAMLNQKYAQSAAAYGNTAAGAQDRFRVALENFQEVLGAQALPAIAKYLNVGADWLNDTRNQQAAVHTLHQGVDLLKGTVAALTPIVEGGAAAAKKFSDMIGGARHAIELLLGVMAVKKLTGFAQGLGLVGTNAASASGKVNLLRGSLLGLPAFVGITVGLTAKWVSESGFGKRHHLDYSGIDLAKDIGKVLPTVEGPMGLKLFNDGLGTTRRPVRSGQIGPSPDTVTASQTHRMPETFGTAGGGSAGALATGIGTLSRAQRNALALAQARTSSQELSALAEQRQILANQIRSVRSRLAGARGAKASALATQLRGLYEDDKTAADQIASIHAAGARDAAAAERKASEAAKKAAAKLKAAREKQLKETAKLAKSVFAKYPGLSQFRGMFAFKQLGPSAQGYQSESYGRGDSESFNPKKLAIGLYGKGAGAKDIAGEIVSHFLAQGVSGPITNLYKQFAKTITDQQMAWLKRDYAREGEDRPFGQYMKMSGIPALFRGSLFGQLDSGDVTYTKQQLALFKTVKQILGGKSFKTIQREAKAALAAHQQAAQYRSIGLMGTGEDFAPTRGALLKETSKLAGTLLDSDPNRNRLAKIRKALQTNWQALTRETKQAIKGLLDAMDTGGDKGPQIRAKAFNPASLTKGLGLTRAEAKAIQFRIAGMHLTQTPIGAAAGGITIHVHSRSSDPNAVARETIAALQKAKGRRSTQVRGPHAGHPLGI